MEAIKLLSIQSRRWAIPVLVFLRFVFAVIGIALLISLTQSKGNELLQRYFLLIFDAAILCVLLLFLQRERKYRPGTGGKLRCTLLTGMTIGHYMLTEFTSQVPVYRVVKKHSTHDIRKNTPVHIYDIEYWTQ